MTEGVDESSGQSCCAASDSGLQCFVMSSSVLSVTEAAAELGITDRHMRRLCAKGQIGRRVGRRAWVLTPDEVEREKQRRTKQPKRTKKKLQNSP
jgi:hypothetical protein